MRKNQMFRALRWSFLLFLGFLVVTQQVLSNGPLVNFDNNVNHTHHPQFSGFAGFVLRRLDDLGLRWLTATVLIIAATYISYKFKTWRPINLAVLSVLALNFVVGVFKLFLGRTKPRDGSFTRRWNVISEWPCIKRSAFVGDPCIFNLSLCAR